MSKLVCSIDEFSLMFYNYSLNEVFDQLDLPHFQYSDDMKSFRSKSGTLQALGMDYNLEREGIMINFSVSEWTSILRDCSDDPEAFDFPFLKIRVHVHHEGLYCWFLRSGEKDYITFNLILLHGLLARSVGTSDKDLKSAFSKITRLDIAYDLFNCPESVTWLDYFCESKMLLSDFYGLKGQKAASKVTFGKNGKTLYIGSDAAERKLRVYDKKGERGYVWNQSIIDVDDLAIQTYPFVKSFLVDNAEPVYSWIRFEIETRRDESALYLPKDLMDITFLDCPEFSFYDTIKFIHVNREGHELVEDPLRKLFYCQPVKYQKSNSIIQNEYDASIRFESKLKKANIWILFAKCLKGVKYVEEKLKEIEADALDPKSSTRLALDREARVEGYLSFLDMPGVDHINLNNQIVFKYNVDEFDQEIGKHDYSIKEFEDHFEQLDLFN